VHPIQERQTSPIRQRAPQFAPLRSVKFFHRRGDLSRGPCAIIQTTIRPEQLQRCFDPFPRPLRAIVAFHQPLDLLPRPGSRSPKPTAVAAMTPRALDLAVGFFRPRPPRFQAIPELSQHPLRFLFGVEDIQTYLQMGRIPSVLPLLLEIGQTSLEAATAIDDRLLQSLKPL
jgi:hypothetical protein